MSDLRPRGVPILLGGGERHFLFTINVIDELQNAFGKTLHESIEDVVGEMDDRFEHGSNVTRHMVAHLLNDEADRLEMQVKALGGSAEISRVTDASAGDLIGLDNYLDILRAIFLAYNLSMPEPEENDPNAKSGQTNR